MRDLMLLGTRLVLGSYLAVHGTQKLFGAFGGPGLERAGAGFERIGLTPGKPMAALAGAAELGGGLLTAAGVADPAGPLAIMGAMTVASATHRASGPLAANRGFELPLTNLAAAAALAASGPGRAPAQPAARPAPDGRGRGRWRAARGGLAHQDAHRGPRAGQRSPASTPRGIRTRRGPGHRIGCEHPTSYRPALTSAHARTLCHDRGFGGSLDGWESVGASLRRLRNRLIPARAVPVWSARRAASVSAAKACSISARGGRSS